MAVGRAVFVLLFALGSVAQAQPAASTPGGSSLQRYRIAGVLLNSLSGGPIASATVAIAPTTNLDDNEISRTVTTSADGRFAFAGLTRGKYSMMASARGFGLQYFDHHDAYATAIAVGPDLDSEQLVFRLQPDASIEGQVADENGDPVPNAMVRLFERRIEDGQQKTSPMNQAQTDDQGHFHIGHLAMGTYYLAVAARPWYAQNDRSALRRRPAVLDAYDQAVREAAALDVTYPLTFYPDSPDSAGASPIVLHPGERATADMVMQAVPALHLRIRTGGGSTNNSPVTTGNSTFPKVSQRLFEGYLDPVFNAPVSRSEAGVVELMGLAPGHYIIEMPGSSAGNEKVPGRAWYREIDLAGDAELNAGDAPAFATVSGSVSFQGAPGVPKDTALRLSNPATGESFSTLISSKGQIDFSADAIRPGRYNVSLASSERFFLSKISATGARLIGRTLEIGGGSNVHIVGVATRGVAQVDGLALRDGQPFAGAMIVLVPGDPANNLPLFRRDQSDSDGTFTLPNVVPGQYTVVALANGWDLEWSNPATLKPYLKGGETVQVSGEGKLQIKVQVQ